MRYWRAMIATTVAIAGLGLVGVPAYGADTPNPTQPAGFPDPGTLNYVEGSASLDGQALNNKSVAKIELKAGQELTTGDGEGGDFANARDLSARGRPQHGEDDLAGARANAG